MAMTDEQKIAYIKSVLGDSSIDDSLLTNLLLEAKESIMLRIYPIGDIPTEAIMPTKYDILQCKLVVRYYSRMGSEGELIHNENGINRTYGSVDDEDLLSEVTQKVRL